MQDTLRRALLAPLLATTLGLAPASSARIDVAGVDRDVPPGDDFFGYANGGWLKSFQMPPDRAVYGSFTAVEEVVTKRTVELIRQAAQGKPAGNRDADADAGRVGDYYTAYMDEKAIEDHGLAPVKSELDAIRAIGDRAALARVLGSELRADVDALNNTNFHTDRLLGLWVAPAFADPDRYVGYLMQGGLGMPDRDEYTNTDAKTVELQGKYRDHIAAILRLARVPDAEGRARRVYELEREIAGVHVSRTDSVDVHKADNPWKLPDFAVRAPGLDWNAYFAAAGLAGQPTLMVWHPSAVAGIAALAGREPLETWRDYLAFHAIDRVSALLPKAFADERFRFYGTVLTGATKPRDRWKRAVAATGGALGDAVGRLYVTRYFPPESKAQCQAMVKNIVAAFRRRIDGLDWMSPATREKAKAKLDTLYIGIGYPEHWRDYAGLAVDRSDALGNAQRSELFDYRWQLAKLGRKVDRTEWCMEPQTVNAVNLPLQNALNFPAAILNPPFFDPAADPAQNYGAIGSVIGHEISHSFDDQGSQFDADGRLANWWTKEDFEHFQAAAEKLAAQYDAYEPLPGLHVNGKLTLSENIADVAGISAAYDGYRASGAGKPAEAGGFTGDQLFFLAFAQAWRGAARPEALRNQLMTDGHAPGRYRAATVRNVDAWYPAFDVRPGLKLYLAPQARVRVW
jgi:putative endopeptidase